MIFRIILTVFLSLVLVGCAGEKSSSKKTPPVTAAKSEKKTLRGLQSLTRVQLKVPEELHAYAVEQLRKQLPQLNTAGSSDDWTLEFVLGLATVQDPMMAVPRLVSVSACHCRLFRKAVVNGRFATAVAYEGASFVEQRVPYGWSGPKSSKQILLGSITKFVSEWRQANPNSEGK